MKSKSVGRGKPEEKKKKKAKKLPKKIKPALQKKKSTLKQLLSGVMDINRYVIKGAKFKKVPNGVNAKKCAAIEFCGAQEGHPLEKVSKGMAMPVSLITKETFTAKGYIPSMQEAFLFLWQFLRGEGKKTEKDLPATKVVAEASPMVQPKAPAVDVSGEKKKDEPHSLLVTYAMMGVVADSQESANPPPVTEAKKEDSSPVKSDSKEFDKKMENKKKHPDIGVLKARKNGDFEFEGVKLFAKEVPDRKRVDVFVLFVPDSHPDYEHLAKIKGQKVYLSTFIARKYDKYPREKLLSHLADKVESLEALWRLVRRALGVTKPIGSAELKKVA